MNPQKDPFTRNYGEKNLGGKKKGGKVLSWSGKWGSAKEGGGAERKVRKNALLGGKKSQESRGYLLGEKSLTGHQGGVKGGFTVKGEGQESKKKKKKWALTDFTGGGRGV